MASTRTEFRDRLGLGLMLGLLLALALLPLFAGFAGLAWEVAQGAGLLGALATLLLAGAALRPRAPAGLVTLRLHGRIGWFALVAVSGHVVGLVLADRVTIEYLKPSAPLHQLAGIAAAALLLLLTCGASAPLRRRVWPSHRVFASTHLVATCAMTVLIAAHVIVSARYVGGAGRRAIYVAAAAAALLMLLRGRGPARRLAIAVAVAAGVVALALLLPERVDARLREPVALRQTGLALDFPHGKHGAVKCLTCHHNYADRTGKESCMPCHSGGRADLRLGVEARMHGFCLDCHRHPNAALRKQGPVAGCAVCHRAWSAEAPAGSASGVAAHREPSRGLAESG
ncbi:MAG: cytochrome c3 family protein [Burkholderiales bacterium]|nr:cytochrome c3 family protein [Burkholderiales bacterium]